MKTSQLLVAAATAACCVGVSDAWYLPGAKAKEYAKGENVKMFVNSMSSVNTHLPFDYYSLPFCQPANATRGKRESLGEILMGDRIKASPYEGINLGDSFACKALCTPKVLNEKQVKRFERLISEEYVMQLILDGLPVAVNNTDTHTFSIGFPLGGMENKEKHYINNHLHFNVKYHRVRAFEAAGAADADLTSRIVSFTVRPSSIKHRIQDGKVATCTEAIDPLSMGLQYASGDEPIAWSYGVTWEETDDTWGARWDVFLNIGDAEIHWFSIVNSVMIAFFLSGILAAIMLRTLLRDIAHYNAIEDADDLHDETGWKLVHSDVFRPPVRKHLLATYVGTGVQLLGMCFTVLIMACLGFLSPASGGALFTSILLLFVFLGYARMLRCWGTRRGCCCSYFCGTRSHANNPPPPPALDRIYGGYTSARLMKMWDEHSWWTAFQTATHVPGIVFSVFFFINLFVWYEESTGAVPFSMPLTHTHTHTHPPTHFRRDGGCPRHLVLHLDPPGLPGRHPRLQEGDAEAACAHQPDLEVRSDPGMFCLYFVCRHTLCKNAPPFPAEMVPAALVHDHVRRCAAFRGGLHRTVLHPDVDLDAPLLLRVRLPAPGLRHPVHHVRRDHDCDVLLPAVRGGPLLVVAVVLHVGFVGCLRLPVLDLLLLHFVSEGTLPRAIRSSTRTHAFTFTQMTRFTPVLLFFGYMAVISYIFFVITGTIGFIACFWYVVVSRCVCAFSATHNKNTHAQVCPQDLQPNQGRLGGAQLHNEDSIK